MGTQENAKTSLLNPETIKTLHEMESNLRDALIAEASRLSSDGTITEENLVAAYKNLSYPDPNSLQFIDAQSVISQALRENRIIEWVSYGMAIVLFIFGLVLLTIGATNSDSSMRTGCLLSGSIVELLILVPFRFAIHSRRHNIALRMLGLVINRVDDPKKLAPLLKDTFLAVVLGRPEFREKQ
ncbi:MAG: hypothetical protein Tsb009_12280 [Planctomycetaceae bacterium]